MSYFSEHGPALVKLGYEIVPLAPGCKYPKGVPAWQTQKNTKETLSMWNKRHPEAGVGIRCASTPAIDIDVYDSDVSGKLADWLRERLGGTVIERVGEAPKILFPCQMSAKTKKITSAKYTDIFDMVNQIEILGDGQQFVAYHIHPDTNKPFHYVSEKSLHEVKRKDLPLVTPKLLRELFDYFDSIVPEGWVKKEGGINGNREADVDNPMAGLKPKVDLKKSEVVDLLGQLPNDDFSYDTYIQVGMGLHHQFDGDERGFELWSQWCDKSEKNDDLSNRLKWKSFGKNTSMTPVTLASVLKIANNLEVDTKRKEDVGDEPTPDEAPDVKGFLKRYAYMPEDNQIFDMDRPLDRALIPFTSFKNLTANKLTEVSAATTADPDKTKLVSTSGLWLSHEKRMTVEGTTFQPGEHKKIIRSDDRRLLVNMAHFPEHSKHFDKLDENVDRWRMNVFNRHMEYLFPLPEQRQWFVQWLAFNVQNPGERCKVTPLHVSKPHGTGRGWVVSLIEKLLGTWNVSKTTISEMCGEGSKGQYDDYLYRTLVCCVEEAKATDKRYSVSDLLRDKLTEPRLNVNLKYGGKKTIDVFTCFFWMSNHDDAVVLPVEDRRIHVLEGPNYVQTGEYYDELYAWIKSPLNVAYLWQELGRMDLTGFQWKVAPITEARKRMIEYTQTPTEDVFKTWLSENTYEWLLFDDIREKINMTAERDGMDEMLSDTQIRKLLQQHGRQWSQVRLGERRVRPWYMGSNPNVEVSPKEIQEILTQQENT